MSPTATTTANRLPHLDYLRGLAACSIMVYHYLDWTIGYSNASSFLTRLGIYCIPIFYLISGITLYHVYHHRLSLRVQPILDYFKRRVLRIYPLLWLTILLTLALSYYTYSSLDLVLNFTGLFGFFKWDRSIAAGSWSIGNELVFYVFFPAFLFLFTHFPRWMYLVGLGVLGIFLFFTFHLLDPQVALDQQWKHYVNPLNQVFFFFAGTAIAHVFRKTKLSRQALVSLFFLGIAVLVVYPAEGDRVVLVTGFNRLVFAACCMVICLSAYQFTFRLPQYLHQPLSLLGAASYSIYLLHPIVFRLSTFALDYTAAKGVYIPQSFRLIACVVLSLALSYFVYTHIERYFIQLGRKTNATRPT